MGSKTLNWLATVLFVLAVVHTLGAGYIRSVYNRAHGRFLHIISEVELIFAIWAGVFVVLLVAVGGPKIAIEYVGHLDFKEPLFVFAVMAVAATGPIVGLAKRLILKFSRRELAVFFACLALGPLLGSLITEPAAMTICSLILLERYFSAGVSTRFKYVAIAVLFVNISIGGVLTHFAAPPVVMVADKWGWSTVEVFRMFGWKALIAVALNAAGAAFVLRSELLSHRPKYSASRSTASPYWLVAMHVAFLCILVALGKRPLAMTGVFIAFLIFVSVTKKHQSPLKLKESAFVGAFLGGVVVLGHAQQWWLEPLISGLGRFPLFLGSAVLTSFTDNAALTYLGSLIPGLAEPMKYAIVAGSVAAGGLTVIANAPNPAGYAILQDSFGAEGISAWRLFVTALAPTIVAMAALWLL